MIRVGIVGMGIRGMMYARAVNESGLGRVEAVCDISERSRESAKALDIPVYASHQELYERATLDAVIIATPDFAHREPAVDAAARGLHLMIEKPLATSLEDAAAIRDAVRDAGVRCMIAFENRWNPAFVQARAAIARGEVGAVRWINARLNDTIWVPTGMLGWAARSSPGWFLLPHIADLAMWLSGARPRRVYAAGLRGQLSERGVDTWDALHVLVEWEPPMTTVFEVAWTLPESLPNVYDFKFELVGESGALFIDTQDQMVHQAGERWTYPGTLVSEIDGRLQGFPIWMTQRWLRGLAEGADLEPGVDQGYAVTRLCWAAHRSAEVGEPIEVGG
ncbi:MAG TPA: Gfo/Idh/MocA family oxidoreductase [Caldilineae bacterium]|nr:Gfo/Idh/MocA family oxidoreductase [Caldilineae bacterium]